MGDRVAPSAPPAPPRVIGSFAAEYVAYTYKSIVVVMWIGPASAPGVRSYQVAFQAQLAESPILSAVHVMVGNAAMPDAEGRKEFELMAKRYSKRCACIVSVIEREGFVGSALRALNTGLYAITSRDTLHRVVRTMDEAAKWMCGPHTKGTGVPVDPVELASVFAAIRAKHL